MNCATSGGWFGAPFLVVHFFYPWHCHRLGRWHLIPGRFTRSVDPFVGRHPPAMLRSLLGHLANAESLILP